jgi:hypothetical protein
LVYLFRSSQAGFPVRSTLGRRARQHDSQDRATPALDNFPDMCGAGALACAFTMPPEIV